MGFDLVEKTPVDELGITIHLYTHTKTGLELAHLVCDDNHKVFLISFATPPYDSSGLPHILEHMVLCGSKRFPLKEPFRELMKGTLNTFLNAFTYPDRTVYPVASYHEKDLLNLMEVYLDAVFAPLLSKYSFFQEAWHIDPKTERVQGVVYNEMKGAYSSPERVLGTFSLSTLYPGHPYFFDSGGRPEEILGLAYERVLAFHKKYYCPRNGRVVLYGNMDLGPVFRLLEDYLSQRDGGDAFLTPEHSGLITNQYYEDTYLSKEGEQKALVSINWGLGETIDISQHLLMSVLEEALLGSPGAPLRKRIVDSGLGEDLVGEGVEKELKYLSFHVGLKGIELQRIEEFKSLLIKGLEELAQKGIPHEFIEAGLNRVEFRLREGSDGLNKALNLSLRALNGWFYGAHPKVLLKFFSPLEKLKRTLLSDTIFLKDVIHRLFLTNPRRVLVLLKPNPKKCFFAEEEERSRVRALLKENRHLLEAEYKHFVAFMEREETESEKALIPRLHLRELPRSPRNFFAEDEMVGGARFLIHPMETSGVFYVDFLFNVDFLDETNLVLLPLLGRCLLEMPTKRWSIEELSSRIGRITGGFYPESLYFHTLKGEPKRYLVFRAKGLNAKAEAFLELISEIFFQREKWVKERFWEILKEEIAKVEERLMLKGHEFMVKRAIAHFGEAFFFGECVSGIKYLMSLRRLRDELEADWLSIKERLDFLYQRLLNQKDLILNLTCDAKGADGVRPLLDNFVSSLPFEEGLLRKPLQGMEKVSEGLGVPSQVYYVGLGINLDPSHFTGAWFTCLKYLRTSYLWEEVRMKAGAYGAFVGLDRSKGVLWFSSYRDPNPGNTIKCLLEAGEFLRSREIGTDELERLIIGAIGDLDRHMEPGERGYRETIRTLKGEDWDCQLKVWEEVLATGLADIKRFGEVLREQLHNGVIKVMGPLEGLRQLNLESLERIL